jgi:hypothetical protein
MSFVINVLCFMGGGLCGVILLCLFTMAGKADEDAGIK